MVNLRSLFGLSFVSKLFKFKFKKFKTLPLICLGLSLITVSTIAVLTFDSVKPEPINESQDLLIEDDLHEDFEIEQNSDSNSLSNRSLYPFYFIVPLYSKLNASDIFENNYREDILNLITEDPGITLSSITRQLNLKPGTATHHIRILEREEYIKSKKTGKFRRYYRVGIKATGFNEIQDNILLNVEQNPGISQSEIARELNLSRQLINYHMKDLVSLEVIKIEKIGNKNNCFLH